MIGKMRHRITVQVITIVEQPGGGLDETWADELTTWASVKPLKSSRLLQDNQVKLMNGYTIVLRWADGRIMDKKRRIVHNGETLTINGAFVIDEAKRFWQITAIINE